MSADTHPASAPYQPPPKERLNSAIVDFDNQDTLNVDWSTNSAGDRYIDRELDMAHARVLEEEILGYSNIGDFDDATDEDTLNIDISVNSAGERYIEFDMEHVHALEQEILGYSNI